MGSTARARRLLAGAIAVLLGGGLTLAAPVAGTAPPPPKVFAAAVEGTGVRHGVGALNTFVDPGTAYTAARIISNQDIDGDQVMNMRAVGANVDPGTLIGAVIWEPPNCEEGAENLNCYLSGEWDDGAPDTGLQEPAGWPFYAEAFHPAFGAQAPRSEKCLVNKDAQESPECRELDSIMYAEAVVTPDEVPPVARGFARTTGTDQGDLAIGESEALGVVTFDETGRLVARHEAWGRRIEIAGTPLVAAFSVWSEVVATAEGVVGSADCRSELTLGGEALTTPDEIATALAALGAATGEQVRFTPPTEATLAETAAGGFEAGCVGARLDVRNVQTGERVLYELGRTTAVAAPLGEVFGDAAVGVDLDQGLDTPGLEPASPASGPATAPSATGPGTAAPPSDAGTDEAPAQGQGTDPGPTTEEAFRYVEQRIDGLPVGLATGAAAVGLLGTMWLLIGVVGSLGRGGPLRLPGL